MRYHQDVAYVTQTIARVVNAWVCSQKQFLFREQHKMSTENQPDINKLLDTGNLGQKAVLAHKHLLQPKVERKQCAFLFFFSSLPLSHQAIWKYFKVVFTFFFLSQKRCMFFPCSFSNTQSSGHPFLMWETQFKCLLQQNKEIT